MRSALNSFKTAPAPKSATDLLKQRAETAGRKGAADDQPTLRELLTDGAAMAMAQIDPAKGPVLWISDHLSRREAGVICMAELGASHRTNNAINILRVDVSKPVDVLWAMEQGLGCATLGAVVDEIWGDPPALDFTASKRLVLRSEAHAVPHG